MDRLLRGDYAGRTARHAFAPTSVVLPCAAGLLYRLLLPHRLSGGLAEAAVAVPLPASLLLTYVLAGGVLGPFLGHPRPVLLVAALAVAATVCGLSFTLGRLSTRVLRLDARAGASVTPAFGMNNSSGSAAPTHDAAARPAAGPAAGALVRVAAERGGGSGWCGGSPTDPKPPARDLRPEV
ncbi:hypothetical protein ACWC09_07070 [Streptomyces sp. NPDC001617]